MDKLSRCFQNGLLTRSTAEPELAEKSLTRAKEVLKEVPQALSINLFEMAEQRLYQAVFHGVKSLLYKDGIRERSHTCVSLYFKEKYKKTIPEDKLDLLDRLRDVRHESQYGLETVILDKEQIMEWCEEARELISLIEKLQS